MAALLGGGVILVIALLLLNLPDRNTEQAVNGTPTIVVDQERIDYGDVKLDTPLTFKFTVTNTGDGELRFSQEPFIEVIEGC
jgi:hypothetical protein